MQIYRVKVEYTGSYTTEVFANDEDEAIEKVENQFFNNKKFPDQQAYPLTLEDVFVTECLEAYRDY